MSASNNQEEITCRFCGESILAVAIKCRHCEEYLDPSVVPLNSEPGDFERLLIPSGRPGSAIAAGYCALFGILPGIGLPFSIAAVWCGLNALAQIKKNPKLSGKGRAWFGIVLGIPMTVISFVILAIVLIGMASELSNT